MKMINSEDVKKTFMEISNNQYKQYCLLRNGDILIGRNKEKYCFVIRGDAKRQKYKSSTFVQLDYEILPNGNKQLLFTLQDQLLFDIFLKLLEDIVVNIDISTSIIESSYSRWLIWKAMFSNQKIDILPVEQIRGLIGELYSLKGFLNNKYTIEKSVYAWGGANYNKKDFEIGDIWYEIKTTIKSPGEVEISSLEQLESNKNGYLIVHSLEKSTPENIYSTNLNKIVDECIKLISDSHTVEVFIEKLSKQGYVFNDKYNDYNFNIKKTEYFNIDTNFPKLTTSNVFSEIIKCTYTLSLNAISKFKVMEGAI